MSEVGTRILVVDDDRKAARLIEKGLREDGYDVDTAHSAEEADPMVKRADYAAIVLDWLLPGQDGLTLCRDLRACGIATPILIVTARDAVDDRVTGLDTGADDFLTKPFAFQELLARLRALLRRSVGLRPVAFTVADLSLDPV